MYHINFAGKPWIQLAGGKEIVLKKGQKLSLDAKFHAPDDARIEWQREGKEVRDERSTSTMKAGDAQFLLTGVTKADEGKYTLLIDSPTLGQASGQWNVKILGETLVL